MAYCEKCGKETKDGQIYCESCLAEMEDHSFDDMFQSIGQKNTEVEPENADDDFSKIIEELQGPRDEKVQAEKKDNAAAPSTVSDVFSDAVSAISSLEDEFGDMLDKNPTSEHKEEKKSGLLSRLFRKKSKESKMIPSEDGEDADSVKNLDKKARRLAKKEQKKQKKAELAKKKEEAAKKAKEEKLAAKQQKEAATQPDETSESKEESKKIKSKKAEKNQPEKKKAIKEKPKKEKIKKEKIKKEKKPKKDTKPNEDVEETIVEEDLGHFNIPVMIIVFAVFILGIGYIVLHSFRSSYDYSIEVASRKFDKQEYNEAYEEIYGVDVKDEDTQLYDKIMTVMYVNKQLNSYNNFMGIGMYPEALDSLIKGLKRYETYIVAAKELGITDDLDYVRGQILEELKREFGLSEKKATKLMMMEDKTEYSIKIYDIVLESTDYVNK